MVVSAALMMPAAALPLMPYPAAVVPTDVPNKLMPPADVLIAAVYSIPAAELETPFTKMFPVA